MDSMASFAATGLLEVLRFLDANKSTYVAPFARLQKEVEARSLQKAPLADPAARPGGARQSP